MKIKLSFRLSKFNFCLFSLFHNEQGAGQDSCLTCAPAHLHVVDLAVCLQVCPDGYYESKIFTIFFTIFSFKLHQ